MGKGGLTLKSFSLFLWTRYSTEFELCSEQHSGWKSGLADWSWLSYWSSLWFGQNQKSSQITRRRNGDKHSDLFLRKDSLGFLPFSFQGYHGDSPGDTEEETFLSPILLFGLDKRLKTGSHEADLCMHASLSKVARCPQLEGSFWSGFSVHKLKASIKFAFFSTVWNAMGMLQLFRFFMHCYLQDRMRGKWLRQPWWDASPLLGGCGGQSWLRRHLHTSFLTLGHSYKNYLSVGVSRHVWVGYFFFFFIKLCTTRW